MDGRDACESQRWLAPGARIAIVGGGTIGLLACKQCLERGYRPTVFEKRAGVGGVWRQDDSRHSAAYDSLYTNSSRTLMQISDFPFPFQTSLEFPTRAEIVRYYERYCDHNDLWRHAQLGAAVVDARIAATHPDGSARTWRLRVRRRRAPGADGAFGRDAQPVPPPLVGSDGSTDDDSDGEREEYDDAEWCAEEPAGDFDALFLCSGQFSRPSWPSMPRGWQRRFTGVVRHSQAYRNAAGLRGQHVLLLGVGNSALDIALEAARGDAASVTIVCRGGTTIIPVADDDGRPMDGVLLTRLFQSLLPPKLRMLFFYLLTRATNEDFHAAGLPEPDGGFGSTTAAKEQFSNLKEHQAFRALLQSGKIRIKCCGQLAELDGRRALFDTAAGSGALSIPCDELIVCTGYQLSFPFLDRALARSFHHRERSASSGKGLQWLELYKYVMHAAHPTLCVLGIVNSLGNESLVGELQARWALAVLGREAARPLPSPARMAEAVAARSAAVRKKSPKFASFINYSTYCDELAADIGCMPRALAWSSLLTPSRWRLLWALLAKPIVQAQYRLDGPDAWPEAERFLTEQVTSTAARLLKPPPSRL